MIVDWPKILYTEKITGVRAGGERGGVDGKLFSANLLGQSVCICIKSMYFNPGRLCINLAKILQVP